MSRSPELTPERWRALEPLLDAALELPAEARDAFVQRVCADDVDTRRELTLLLAGCDQVANGATRLELAAAARFAGLWDEGLDHARLVEAIASSYTIEHELGRGGAAIVYRARNVRTGQLVAIKVMRSTVGPRGPLRFRREIALASRLEHPCIVSPLEAGECAERLWYTMPLVEGESLRERLQRERSLAIPVALDILAHVADALECAHTHGIVHRDLKPENILLDADHVRVADFGVAKAVVAAGGEPRAGASAHDPSTATGVTVGTPAYMAPEQAGGAPHVDHRVDLYALGLIAYEMLAGTTPFQGTSRQALLTAQLSARPVPVRKRRRDVPPALDRLVTRLLAKAADERPSSAAEVREALLRCAP